MSDQHLRGHLASLEPKLKLFPVPQGNSAWASQSGHAPRSELKRDIVPWEIGALAKLSSDASQG